MKIYNMLILLLVLSLLPACSILDSSPDEASEESFESSESYEEPNLYYDFDDVLIPRELEPVDEEKYVFSDKTFHAGFRVFEGRVVAADVCDFFINNMAKDGWDLKYSLNSLSSVFVFEKANKSCTITVEDAYQTKVTIFAVELTKAESQPSQVLETPVF